MVNKGVDVLVGLQYGSEGKGKIAAFLANDYDISVRVGAYQAGHTITYKGKDYKMQCIPCQWINPDCKIVIGAGGFIRLDILAREIKWIENAGVDIRNRLFIDFRTTIGEPKHAVMEGAGNDNNMFNAIGSTQEGVGAALIEKIKRKGGILQAKDISASLTANGIAVIDTIRYLNQCNDVGKKIFIEGTQGCHLSLTTSNHYPMCTSRDCNVSGILADCGLSPLVVNKIIGVMRTYPIRVAGNSGDTGREEITWDEVTERAGSVVELTERTTVTNRTRRVFEFSRADVQAAIRINQPTHYALMFVDYLNMSDRGVNLYANLSLDTQNKIKKIECNLGINFSLVSTGSGPDDMVVLKNI